MSDKDKRFRCPVCGWEGTSSEIVWDSDESSVPPYDWWDIEACPKCFDEGITYNWVEEIKDDIHWC